MAEGIIFEGSPLDQYLQEADQPKEQSATSDSSHNNHVREPSTPDVGSDHAPRPAATLSVYKRRKSSTSPGDAHGSTILESTTSLSTIADRNALASPSSSVSSFKDGPSEHRNTLRSRQTTQATLGNAGTSSISAGFFLVTGMLRAFIEQFLMLLALSVARDIFGLQQTRAASANSESPRHQQNGFRSYARTASNRASNDTATSFIERFKYAVCSSFLLTPSLSISFYESSPPFQSQSSDLNVNIKQRLFADRVSGRRPSATPIHKQCYVEPADAPASLKLYDRGANPNSNHHLPRLDAHGRRARNAAIISALWLIPPISKSWRLWSSTSLLIACVAWGYILLFGHSAADDRVHFMLSRRALPNAARSTNSLRELHVTSELSESEQAALQRSVLMDVTRLIKAAQRFDMSINKAINAVQEVETVSRGYKLTHPLPPISRIEAASAFNANNVASSPRQRRSMVFVPATGKLGRSLSGGGNGAPTIKRHTQRPLSLNLSNGRTSPLDRPSGRASPSLFAESGDTDLTQRLLAEQGDVASAAGRNVPQRLIALRKGLVTALDEVGAACISSVLLLQTLADTEELALLHDLYALDASSQEDANDGEREADVSHAWTNGDTSALSEDFHNLEHDRKGLIATTPRSLGSNVRSADVSSFSDVVWRSEFSPQTGSHHKRLSLVSDGGSILDRPPRATSSLSRRSSLVSESGNLSGYRSPRFNYVSERSVTSSGPNESAAAKRLSYVSSSSVATGSYDTRSPVMRNSSVLSSTFTSPHSSAQTYSAATSPQSRANKRSSIVGPNSIFAQLDASTPYAGCAEPADPLSLLSIKSKFEWMHKARRRWLCHLLALRLTMSNQVPLADGASLPCDEYWTAARSAVGSLKSTLLTQDRSVTDLVAKEMGIDSLGKANLTSKQDGKDSQSESQNGLLAVPIARETGAFSIAGHPGIEDRLQAMMLSLRSLQSKIRVCAEDIRVKAPPGLHGFEDDAATEGLGLESKKSVDDAATARLLEKTLESMRDDLLGLSAEWEATVKLINKEKRRSPSPNLSNNDVVSDVAKSNAARDLESPLEADEDADQHGTGKHVDEQDHLQSHEHGLGGDGDEEDDDDDSDLAQLLLRSTSPNSLPPPGLEQVFESIAGMAGLSSMGMDARKLSRAERIEQSRLQREQEKQDKASRCQIMDPSSMMSELSGVIQSRKAEREQRRRSARSPAPTTTLDAFGCGTDQPALALGSPLDLGSAGHEGVFGAAHSFVPEEQQALPRRSLSSLDLARARALQTLESRSPSVASSNASNSFDGESQPRMSNEDFSFEPTPLESVPENPSSSSSTRVVLPPPQPQSPQGENWDSTSRKTTPKASHAPLSSSINGGFGEGPSGAGQDSTFDLGAQVAAYARRKAAARAAEMHVSGSEGSIIGSQM